jgi:hypothetical protein
MRQNSIHGAEAGKAFSDMLAQNTVLNELDLSNQQVGNCGEALDAAFAREMAVGISGNGAISSVNVLGNFIGVEQALELIKILHTKEKLTTLCGFIGDETELNLSKKNLSAGCGVLVANEFSDMRALLSLNISDNQLVGKKGTGRFTEKTCYSDGDTDDEAEEITEPDFSGVIAIANAIPDMGALTKLDLSSNDIGAEQEGGLQRICVAGGIELAK